MQAVILAGGLGTRLRELYPDRPKALVPVNGRPFLAWQAEWLAAGGITDIHLATGHMSGAIVTWAGQNLPGTIRFTASEEPEPLGTGGGLKFVEEHIQSDPFYVLNGDSLLPNADFQSLENDFRESSNAWISIAVARIEEAGRYGTVEFDDNARLTAFREKASRSEGWINAGIYLMSKKTLGEIEPGRNLSMETDIFPALAEKGLIRAFKSEGPLLDMGTPDGLRAMEAHLLTRGA